MKQPGFTRQQAANRRRGLLPAFQQRGVLRLNLLVVINQLAVLLLHLLVLSESQSLDRVLRNEN